MYRIAVTLLCVIIAYMGNTYAVKGKDYQVKFDISQLDPIHGNNGTFIVHVHPSWAPHGAARFKELVESGYFVDNRFFRVVIAYIAEFGYHSDPSVSAMWVNKTIPDDPIKQLNKRNLISFTCNGPRSRSTAVYINYSHNKDMDTRGCAPFGEVTSGMATVDSVFPIGSHGKGDGSDSFGPNRQMTMNEGNAYLYRYFPHLSYISAVEIIPDDTEATASNNREL